jgi:superfamily II DNA or RNA helicase
MVPGYKFTPLYKRGIWDGRIRLFNPMTCVIYAGLADSIGEFCKSSGYQFDKSSDFTEDQFSGKEAADFIKTLKIPEKFELRDYQFSTFVRAVRKRRELYVSPTASGKSMMIYLICRYVSGRKLIIVPTTQLVHQMESDFTEYGAPEDYCHKIMAGADKSTDRDVIVSTWQSIFQMPQEWFDQFSCVVGDEAHLAKAKSITGIMEKCTKVKYRYGFTGTLDGTKCNEMVLNGLFGPTYRVTTSKKLMDDDKISKLQIKVLVLQYSDDVRKSCFKMKYPEEMDHLVRCRERNCFIRNLAISLKGNTLVMFHFVEKHGKVLYDMIRDEVGSDRNVYYISGEVDGLDRDEIRKIIETEDDAIIVASDGTFSTGTNIKKLHNVIFASPSKGKIKNLQSIGRMLRLHDTKSHAKLYDVADDLSWKSHKNFTILHMIERLKIYASEEFPFKTYNISI